MSFTFGFYNSIDGDRMYDADQFGDMFSGLITDGIYSTIGDAFMVTPGTSGLSIIVGSGRAWFNKTWSYNSDKFPMNLELADLLLPRYDTVVLEVNKKSFVRANSIKIITGTPAANPVKPGLLFEDNVYQYPLAHIHVKQNQETVTALDIENVVGLTPCPFVTGILQSVPIDGLYQQWNAQFEDWFANVQEALSGDVAANLLNKINALENNSLKSSDKATSADATGLTNNTRWMTPLRTKEEFNSLAATNLEVSNRTNVLKYVKPDQLEISSGKNNKLIISSGSGSYTVPVSMKNKYVDVLLIGAGGGGGGGSGGSGGDINSEGFGGGGGGGGNAGDIIYIQNYFVNSDYISYSIGIGGKGGDKSVGGPGISGNVGATGSLNAENGSSGGNTVFGNFTALGGTAGTGAKGGSTQGSRPTGGNPLEVVVMTDEQAAELISRHVIVQAIGNKMISKINGNEGNSPNYNNQQSPGGGGIGGSNGSGYGHGGNGGPGGRGGGKTSDGKDGTNGYNGTNGAIIIFW